MTGRQGHLCPGGGPGFNHRVGREPGGKVGRCTAGRLEPVGQFAPDRGQANEEIEVEYGSTDIEIGFNARYLLDIATQLSGDAAEFVFADAGSPTLVKDKDSASVLYVLMPMRV